MPSIDVLHPPSGHSTPIKLRAAWARPALAVAAFGAPLALGGAPAWTVPLFALVGLTAFAVTGVDRAHLRRDRLLVCWLVLLGVLALQLVPLPPALLRLLDADSAAASAGALDALRVSRAAAWRALHHDPGGGLSDFTYLLGVGAAYLAATRVSSREEGDRVVRLVAYAALAVACVALAHQLTEQDRVFAVYQPRAAAPPILSPLLNPNHLAALTGAGSILWLGLAVSSERAAARTVTVLSAVLCGVVCMLSLSRGGVASTVGCILLFAALNARRGTSERSAPRRVPQTWLGLAGGAAVLLAGLYVAATSLTDEYARGGASKVENFRRALGLLRDHWLLGVGSGAVPVAVVSSGRLDPDWTFLRVECLPVDLAVSFGIPAAAMACWFAFRALRDWRPPAQASSIVLGAWCAMLSLVLHDLVDFSLFLGGVGYPAALLAGYLMAQRLRRWQRPLPRGVRVTRVPPAALLAIGLALAPFAWRSTLEADRDRAEELLRRDPGAIHGEVLRAAFVRHPSDAYLPLLVGAHAAAQNDASAFRFVNRALALSPNWAQPHLLLARTFAARGMRSQALVEVREALVRSERVTLHAAALVARLRPLPDRDELDRVAPRSPYGLNFLDATTARPGLTPAYLAAVDEVLLGRDPGYAPALRRRSSAALLEGRLDDARALCDRLVALHPAIADGYLCRGAVLSRQGDEAGAMRTYANGIARASDRYGLQIARARVYAARHDGASMREAVAAAKEAAGADQERLIAASGLLGELETALGNPYGAIEAYLMAHSLAAPEQPYIIELLEARARVGDRAGVEQICVQLSESTPLAARARAHCQRGVTADGGVP